MTGPVPAGADLLAAAVEADSAYFETEGHALLGRGVHRAWEVPQAELRTGWGESWAAGSAAAGGGSGGGRVRSADFAGVRHHVAVAEGTPETVAAAVAQAAADCGGEPLHVSVHAAGPAERDAATAALRAAGLRCAVDALVQPPAPASCAAVLWAVSGDCAVSHPAPGTSRLDFAGGSLLRLGHVEPGAATGWTDLLGRLRGLSLDLDRVWKTWSHLPVQPGREEAAAEFVAFNLHRAEVFGDTAFRLEPPAVAERAYPANTGVADLAGTGSLTGIAGRVEGGIRVLGVENRRQRPPHRYGPGTGRPRPAQFSRAVLLAGGPGGRGQGLALLAGTAAVVTASVDVTNTGTRAGDEVVQLYLHDPVASVSQPVRRLRGFERVTLAPGATRTVSFTLDRSDFGFYDNGGDFVVEPGRIDLYAGNSSTAALTTSFTVTDR